MEMNDRRLAEIEAWYAASNDPHQIPHADWVTIRALCAALRAAWAERDEVHEHALECQTKREEYADEFSKSETERADRAYSECKEWKARAEAAERDLDAALALVAEMREYLLSLAKTRGCKNCRKPEVACDATGEPTAHATCAKLEKIGARARAALSLPAPEALARLTARIEAETWTRASERIRTLQCCCGAGPDDVCDVCEKAQEFEEAATAAQDRAEEKKP